MQYVLNKNHCYLQKMQPKQTKKHKNPVPIGDFPLNNQNQFSNVCKLRLGYYLF